MEDSYWEQMKSPIADMKNTGGRMGGAITAALFLEKYVDTDKVCIHCLGKLSCPVPSQQHCSCKSAWTLTRCVFCVSISSHALCHHRPLLLERCVHIERLLRFMPWNSCHYFQWVMPQRLGQDACLEINRTCCD